MTVFELKDAVTWTQQPGVWIMEQIRDPEPRYYIELNRDSATRQWARTAELKLVAKAQKPDVSPGFVPDKPLF
jgi:hypothetical protein